MNDTVQRFVPLVDFLAEVMGSNTEIVLHDFSDVEHSVVAIRNSHISGRSVGAPATDLALRILCDRTLTGSSFQCNYRGESDSGHQLQSSSFMLRDEGQRIVGMLCINVDLSDQPTPLPSTRSASASAQADASMPPAACRVEERFARSVSELVEHRLSPLLEQLGVPAERFSPEERLSIVRELDRSGVFLLKGAISEVAARLKISEATVYRYIHMSRKEEE